MKPIVFTLALTCSIALEFCCSGVAVAGELTAEAKNEQVMNARRENNILASFNQNPLLHAYDLTVIVDGSSAAIGGTVESAAASDLAARLASGTNGIEHVDNRIRVDARAVPRKRASIESKGG
jgi:hyperosmotically inducible periplasmic protein